MTRTVRFNKDLFKELVDVQSLYKDRYGVEVSMNWLIGHLLRAGMQSAPLLSNP